MKKITLFIDNMDLRSKRHSSRVWG